MTTPPPLNDTYARDRYERATALFDAALDLSVEDRELFVAGAVGQDAAVGAELLSLLQANERLGGFLETTALPDSLRARLQAAVGDRYVIRDRIATGGMASVYRADDLRHQRPVAIKVLSTAGEDHGITRATPQRFLNEIRVTASLQHVNVMPLFDSGADDVLLYFVMPFVDGETLRHHLRRTGPLPIDEAVRLACAVADALDHAHAKGIVHRDLKPENILIRDGQPLVCDFGIALATAELEGARHTQTGIIVGTPQYMSPEQADGAAVIDVRTDVFALGAILYEMISGDPPHVASTSQGVLAKLRAEVPTEVHLLRPTVPETLSRAIGRALAKRAGDRFPSARAFRAAMLASRDAVVPHTALPHPNAIGVASQSRIRQNASVGVVVAALVATAVWVVNSTRDAAIISTPAPRFVVAPIADAAIGRAPTITPDGSAIVYAGSAATDRRIFVRPVAELAARALTGTRGALNTFISPDGRTVAFITTDDRLMRIGIDGGGMRDLGGAFRYSDGAFLNDSVLLLDTFGQTGLTWRSIDTGIAHALTQLDTLRHDSVHLHPVPLGDGRSFLFTAVRNRAGPGGQSGELSLAQLQPGTSKTVTYTPLGVDARMAFAYLNGWILYIRRDAQALMAVRLDLAASKTVGEPIVVLQQSGGGLDAAQLATNGTLLYSRLIQPQNAPVIVDSLGRVTPLAAGLSGAFMNPRVSPDGRRVTVQRATAEGTDAWVYDIANGSQARVTRSGAVLGPTWDSAGGHLIYASTIAGRDGLWRIAADGNGAHERLTTASGAFAPSPSRASGVLLFQRRTNGVWSIWRAPVKGEVEPQPIVTGTYDAFMPSLSPDGRWLLYANSESGRYEVYLRQYPHSGDAMQVSLDGGTEPVWSADGGRIYYRGDRKLLRAEFRGGVSPVIANRRVLFADTFDGDMPMPHRNYDVFPDGERFVMIAPTGDAAAETIVVLDWVKELRAKLASKR
jgi:eukaryotic-like serine/threonine-protein kinase